MLQYGQKIKVNSGLFEGCNGIFFEECEKEYFEQGKFVKKNLCKIEVFFTVPTEFDENVDGYFSSVLKRKLTSVVILISKEYIEVKKNDGN